MLGVEDQVPAIVETALPVDQPCSAAFLDETGVISQDRFFAVGLVKLPEPAKLLRALSKFRDQKHWYGEIHFTQMKARDLGLYKTIVDIALQPGLLDFFCFVADREIADPIKRFKSPWNAYNRLAEQLVLASIHPGELLSLMADNYSAPDHVLFEEVLKANVNRRVKRLAVVSVCRLDSKSCDGLQIADLLTAAIAQEFRASVGLASATSVKGAFAAYVRQKLGTPSCLSGWRNANHSVQLYGPNRRAVKSIASS